MRHVSRRYIATSTLCVMLTIFCHSVYVAVGPFHKRPKRSVQHLVVVVEHRMTLHVLRPMTARKKCKREPEDEISSGCYCLSAPIIMQPDWRKALARLDAHWSTKTK